MTDDAQSLECTLRERFGDDIAVPANTEGLTTLARFAERRSCRDFNHEPVSPELVRLLIATALSAPSKSDLMQIDVVQIVDSAIQEQIGELLPSMPWVKTAPVLLVLCGNGRRLRQVSDQHDVEFGNDHLDAFFNPSVDVGIALGYLLGAAAAMGLGSCPISVIRNHCERIDALLALPELVFPVCGVALGWPMQPATGVSVRLPLDVTHHVGRHDDRTSECSIRDYDERRGRHDGFDPASAQFRGWSRAKALMYAEPQRTDFGVYIRRKGFCLD